MFDMKDFYYCRYPPPLFHHQQIVVKNSNKPQGSAIGIISACYNIFLSTRIKPFFVTNLRCSLWCNTIRKWLAVKKSTANNSHNLQSLIFTNFFSHSFPLFAISFYLCSFEHIINFHKKIYILQIRLVFVRKCYAF